MSTRRKIIDVQFYKPDTGNLNVAKVEGAANPRRQGCSCSNLPQALDNAGDVVPSAFP